ncbi:MAG: dienelactone hydrolase family protein, partial [Rhodospirillales bacterium]
MACFIELTAADGHKMRAYSAGAPDQPRGLVLCHGHAGLNGHIRRVADRMAAAGFYVIAPALFDRAEPGLELSYSSSDRARGHAVAAGISTEDTMRDVAAAAAAFGKEDPVGILGYDFGGTVAWHAAARLDVFRAAVCFYGSGIADARHETPLCPTQLHVGEYDSQISLAQIEAIHKAVPSVAMEVYQGAGHGFACGALESFNPAAAELAYDNTLAFLRQHMNGARRPTAPVQAANDAVAVPPPPAAEKPPMPERRVAFGRRAFG